MNRKVSVLLVISLLIFSLDLPSKERRGAELVVTKNDGRVLKGELIAVKQNSLLLMVSGADVSVDIQEIKVIRIAKKSRFLIGLAVGIVAGSLVAEWQAENGITVIDGESDIALSHAYWIPLGALIGGGIGALFGIDKSIKIEGKSGAEIKKVLDKLRHRARIPNAQ